MSMLARHNRTCHVRHERTEIMRHLSRLSPNEADGNPNSRVSDSYTSSYKGIVYGDGLEMLLVVDSV